MSKVLSVIKELKEAKELRLEELRERYDKADANDFINQSSIAQEISRVLIELDLLKKFYLRMKGE